MQQLPKIGARVIVRIPESRHDTYASGAVEALNHLSGVVEGTKGGSEPQALVTFDAPAPTWWRDQSPPKSWWFCPDELESVITADTITDEQMLQCEPSEYECETCLGHKRIRDGATGDLRRCLDCGGSGWRPDARARCAEILNARGGK